MSRPRRHLRRCSLVALFGCALLGTLTACAPTVSLETAPAANTYRCAEVIVRLPSTIGSLHKRQTDAQSTAAWGNPAGVILRCGLTPPAASTQRCLTVDGVDWLMDSSKAPNYRFLTYGRYPATEVIIDARKAGGDVVLSDLADAVKVVPQTRHCQ